MISLKSMPADIKELILDYVYGDLEMCEKKHKDKFSMKSIEFVAMVSIDKINKHPMLLSAVEVRKQIETSNHDWYLSNILYELKWKSGFVGPRSILFMYKYRCSDGNRQYDTTLETYNYFYRHKPIHLSDKEWDFAIEDVVIHEDINSLLIDIELENIANN